MLKINRLLSCLILLSTPLLCAYQAPPEIEKIIAPPGLRKINLGPEKHLRAVQDGLCYLEIVIPEKAYQSVQAAASELGKYLQLSLGHAIPLVHTPTAGKLSLVLGDQALSRAAGLDPNTLDYDGFLCKSQQDKIFLLGPDDPKANTARAFSWGSFHQRGTLLAVYDFLERFLGVRFYFPGEFGTIVPRHDSLLLPDIDIVERPDYQRRRYTQGTAAWFPETEKDVLYFHKLRMESFYVANCHGLERMELGQRFAASQPDYFSLEDTGRRSLNPDDRWFGSLCYSSPGLRNEVYKDAVAFLHNEPASARGLKRWDPSAVQKGFFNLMPADHFRHCHCERCLKFYTSHHDDQGALVWDFINALSRRGQQENLPGYFTAMAYGHYRELPALDLPDNLLIMVAVRGPWSDLNAESRAKEDGYIHAWKEKMQRKPWLWNYCHKGGGAEMPNIPSCTPQNIGNYYRRLNNDICGSFLEAETDHYLFSYLNYYTYSRVAWDTSTDVDALLAEHHRLMFGAGAPAMQQFFAWVEDTWLKKIVNRTIMTAIGPKVIPPSDYELWEKIYSPEALAVLSGYFAEAEKLTAQDQQANQRLKYFRRHFLGQIEAGATAYHENRSNVQDWTYNVGTLKAGESINIDGILDDSGWSQPKPAYLLPLGKEVAEVFTRYQVRKDADYLYFAVECGEPHSDSIVMEYKTNDCSDIWRDSDVEILLNPSGNRKDYYHLMINAGGYFYDSKCQRLGTGSNHDTSWQSQLTVKTAVLPDRWLLELRLPLESMTDINWENFPVNISRHRSIKKPVAVVYYSWSPYMKVDFHDLENFGRFTLDRPAPALAVTNGDFSAPLTGRAWGPWYTTLASVQDGSVSMDEKIFRVGGQAVKFVNTDGGSKAVLQFMPGLKPHTQYRVTFQVRCEDVKPTKSYGGAVVKYGQPPDQTFWPRNRYQGTMPWTRQGFTFTSMAEVRAKFFLQLFLADATGTAWFDDVQISEIGPAE